jgi:hypothetical protein
MGPKGPVQRECEPVAFCFRLVSIDTEVRLFRLGVGDVADQPCAFGRVLLPQ